MSDNNQPRNEASASLCPLSSQSEPDAASVSTTAASAAAPPTSPLAIPRDLPADTVHFGTDGWRAIIGEDFNTATLARLAEATARVFREDNPLGDKGDACPASPPCANTLYIGYDCRSNAGRYAVLVAAVVAEHGFDVRVCDSYCPTPTLCWSVARDPAAAGGIMLTSSHNPAEYLGVKLRMPDGGASPKEFSDRVEAALVPELPSAYERALSLAELAKNATPGQRATEIPVAPEIVFQDLVGPYLNELYTLVDAEAIRAAGLRVVVDPLFGAGRGYLAALLTALGVKVAEVNNTNDPSFAGLHPEPILPWIKGGLEQTVALGYDACLITDGDADRIGAGDAEGNFVNPHRILALLIAHLAAPAPAPAAPGDTPVPAPAAPTSRLKGTGRRVVRTFSGSNLVKRQCERLGLELTTTPIG
ncbi:MAG: hypothetical protein LBP28_03810, partial [Coriobacteriales bacterium]|nr:hypothetical protein [Coriobacteriales bacterium]